MTKLHHPILKLLAVCLLGMVVMFAGQFSAAAEERAWLAEFNDICAKTEVAMTLSSEELAALLTRCEQLQPAIEAEEPSTRKVYLRRLQQCRDLYRFVLESKTSPPQ
jgi:uncharacterized coiled-coil protein SlyX